MGTPEFSQTRVPGSLLFKIHEPTVRISCWTEGRPATREDVEHSLVTGLPALEKVAPRMTAWRGHQRMDKRLTDPDCVELAEHFLATMIPAGKKRPDDTVKLAA